MKTLTLLIGFYLVVQINAQDTIKGMVFDEKNEPLPFTNVIIKSDGIIITGASTNFEGEYVIVIPKYKIPKSGGYILEVAYVGYSLYSSDIFYVTNNYEEFEDINLVIIENEKGNKKKRGKLKAEKSGF